VVRLWDAAGYHLVRAFKLHKKPISALAFSRDGARLAAAGEDKIISLWNTEDGKSLGKLTGHTDRIPALAWHPKDNVLISIGWDTTARLWDPATLQSIVLLNAHAGLVTALSVNNDGSLIACADSRPSVHIWSYREKKQLHVIKDLSAEVNCLAFNPDGTHLAGNGDRIIHLWNAKTGALHAGSRPRTPAHSSVAVSPDGSRLVTNGGGAQVQVWNAGSQAKQEPVLSLTERETVHALAYSPDGKLIAGAAGKYVRLWDASTGSPCRALEGEKEPFTLVAFSPDSKIVAGAGITGMSVWLWRVADGEPILLIPDALDGCTVESLAFHRDGKLLAVGGIDWMATGGSSGAVCLWDIEARCEVEMIPVGAACLALHPAGTQLAFASLDHTICLWNIKEKQIVAELSGPESTVFSLAYNSDGSLLACGGEDRTLRLFDEDGTDVAAQELDSQVQGLAFSPDGKFIYTANANTTCCQLEVNRLLAGY
jgi:WD40 repeat protein